jgi:hypothetical protein
VCGKQLQDDCDVAEVQVEIDETDLTSPAVRQ